MREANTPTDHIMTAIGRIMNRIDLVAKHSLAPSPAADRLRTYRAAGWQPPHADSTAKQNPPS